MNRMGRMSEVKDVFLGFDPGGWGKGDGNFGWSICTEEDGQLVRFDSGTVRDAVDAVERVCGRLPDNRRVLAAGIDAPMFWNARGRREIDEVIRQELTKIGYREVHKIVLHLNSLFGACLAQGILLASQIHHRFKCPITEVHPGALVKLDRGMCLRIKGLPSNEHERDASFSAYAAWRMHQRVHCQGADNWNDLLPFERAPLFPSTRVSVSCVGYWMPIDKRNLFVQ